MWSGGSSALPFSSGHFHIFTVEFSLMVLILFGTFHKDISHSISHWLISEYKPCISGTVFSYKRIFEFVFLGLFDGSLIILCLFGGLHAIDFAGNPASSDIQELFLLACFYSTFMYKIFNWLSHINILTFIFFIPCLLILIPKHTLSFNLVDWLIDHANYFLALLWVFLSSVIMEYFFRTMALLFPSTSSRLEYYMNKEERLIYEYLEDSEEESEEEEKITEAIPFYKEVANDLREKNLWVLSKAVTG